jgi:hypothetical protein
MYYFDSLLSILKIRKLTKSLFPKILYGTADIDGLLHQTGPIQCSWLGIEHESRVIVRILIERTMIQITITSIQPHEIEDPITLLFQQCHTIFWEKDFLLCIDNKSIFDKIFSYLLSFVHLKLCILYSLSFFLFTCSHSICIYKLKSILVQYFMSVPGGTMTPILFTK